MPRPVLWFTLFILFSSTVCVFTQEEEEATERFLTSPHRKDQRRFQSPRRQNSELANPNV